MNELTQTFNNNPQYRYNGSDEDYAVHYDISCNFNPNAGTEVEQAGTPDGGGALYYINDNSLASRVITRSAPPEFKLDIKKAVLNI